MRVLIVTLAALPVLAGCANVMDRIGLDLGGQPPAEAAEPAPTGDVLDPFLTPAPVEEGSSTPLAPATAAPPPPPAARTAEALDTTTPQQRAAATAPATVPQRDLGKTVVSLGNPARPGLWLETPMVKVEGQGRVTNPANGKSSLVTLIPIDGPPTAGSRLSLPAMRLIGASLTDLTEVLVSRQPAPEKG